MEEDSPANAFSMHLREMGFERIAMSHLVRQWKREWF